MSLRLRNFLAWTALTGLLLVLAVRMTLLEVTVRTIQHVSAIRGGRPVAVPHFPGPTEIVGAGIITLALVGLAVMAAGEIRTRAWVLLAMILAIPACGVVGTLHASNRFAALVGLFDAGMGLLTGWAMLILCNTDRRRQWLVVVLAGFLTMLCVKGFYQRYVEIPETIHYFFQHETQYARQMGWKIHSPEMKLYIGRLKSREVTGFFDLSDAFAEAMCPLLMLAAALAIGLWASRSNIAGPRKQPAVAGKSRRSGSQPKTAPRAPVAHSGDIPLPAFLAVCFGIILFCGMGVVVLTKSKGGMASAGLCLVGLLAAWRWRQWLVRHRRQAAVAVVVLAVTAAAGLLAWGFHFHSLPTKSLKFRWQYWTGAVPMIFHHPLWGVGLNNFGYYYTQYKLPSAPEDVKNPHSVFVRVAAEMGLPAAVLWAAAIAVYFALVLERSPEATGKISPAKALPAGALAAFALAWWWIHFAILGSTKHTLGYVALLDTLYGFAALIGMILAAQAWAQLKPEHRRFVALAGVLGAAGMLLYDQVNMAQVTGSVAMLFWVVLGGLAAPLPPNVQDDGFGPGAPGSGTLAGISALIGAALAALMIWVPMVRGARSWDPSTYEHNYAMNIATGNLPAALRDAQAVLRRDRRSQNWLSRIIAIKIRLGKNPATQVRRMFALNRADARFRFRLVSMRACGLTPAQRVAQLQLALKLNAQLPATEPARFSPRELSEINHLIRDLAPKNSGSPHQ